MAGCEAFLQAGRWSILVTETDSYNHGFTVAAARSRLGCDVSVVSFPKGEEAMALVQCDGTLVERAGVDMAAVTAGMARGLGTGSTWGTARWGRIVAALPPRALSDLCAEAIARSLSGSSF